MKKLFISIGLAMITLTSLFSTAVYKADSISADTKNGIKAETSDKYGIKELCSKFGFDVDAPEYLPDSSTLNSFDYHVGSDNKNQRYSDNKNNTSICLYFNVDESDNSPYLEKSVQMVYKNLEKSTSPEEYILEFNDWELEEPILVNGTEGYIVSTLNQYTDLPIYFIIYYKGNTLMEIFTLNISYDEAYQILKSIK
ncbi:MAG: hypothetical protein IKI94_04430 [Ruminococcus sp.]|nr:hypothetical protein [Ruminococcus sp.]